MRHRNRIIRILLVLCLIVFQAEVMAGSWLPCLHETPSSLDSACPMHAAAVPVQADSEADALFECAKCALTLAIGVLHVPPTRSPGQERFQAAAPRPQPAHFFYQFFPEPARRPPQPRPS